ncbi:hypothetical protein AB0N93_03285 [Streptomyces sp. NPDC091267]|uniref:hypothetical protein n=1 Tax=Streptomyces sp. NPDC091267 TaxID=3155195 RepID=UPI0034189D62
MADEHYEWLDREAAERLLRREPVDPADGLPAQQAERLAAALEAAARTARPATGELPGEAAALAAFRAVPRSASRTPAAAARPDHGPSSAADGADEPGVLAPVHIGRAASGTVAGSAGSRGPRPLRWSRPIRFGLVASLACCAIGGVAVAAGTGVLPGPFGGRTPTPANSVSAAASPEELGSGLAPDDDGTSAPPPGSPGTKTASPPAPDSGRPEEPSTGTPGGSAPTGQDTGGKDDGAGQQDGTASGSAGDTGGTDKDDGTEQPADPQDDNASGAWYAKTLKACRDYRDGKLDDDRRRRLEALAKGARNLDRFCDRMLDKADGDSGGDDNGAPGSGDGSAAGGAGSLPSIGFSRASSVPSAGTGLAPAGSTAPQPPAPDGSAAAR